MSFQPILKPRGEIKISQQFKHEPLSIENANISDSKFKSVLASNIRIECADLLSMKIIDANMSGMRITDANLSDLEIDGAQIGGANIHHIGMPPEGHSIHDPNYTKQRPVRFEDCDFNCSTITRCDLSGIEITECNISGLKINEI